MYNPQELQRKAQLNIHGVDTNAQTSLNNNNPPKQENEQHWLATIGNFVNNIVMGAVKSIEGIVDAGAMLVGLFGADVDDFVSYDFTADIFGADEEGEGLLEWSWGRNLADASYLEDDNIVNQIAEGVGGMLPAVALQFVPGVGQVLSTAMFVGSATGSASESAFQEGATYEQALGYGATAGAIEGVTEMIGGRAIGKATELTDTMLGKFLIRKGWDKAVSKGVGKMTYSFASEGLEEVISDLADPVSKYAWGINDTLEMPTLKDLGKTFIVGGSVGAVLDSFSKGASAIKNHKIGGKSFVKVAENLEDISNTNKALAYLQQHKGITQDRLNNATIRSSERTMDSIEKISEELQSMTDEKRKLAFDTLRKNTSFVDDTFNTDGTIKEEVRNDYAEVMNKGAIYNVSTDLVYKGKALENEIKAVNEEHEMSLELSDTAFTKNQRKSFAKINRSIAKLNEKVGERISIVAIKDNPNANAFIGKNTIFINEKYLEDGQWARYLSHEVSHFAKKSEEFNSFAEYITKNTKDEVLNNIVLDIDKNYKYDLTLDGAKQIINKVQKGEQVSKKESDFYDEVVAHITEDLFTNEESINRLVKNNSSLAQKILNRIKQFLQIFKGTNADSETVINLRKAEMLFEKALSSIGKENKEITQSVDNVLNAGNKLDNSGEIRYSFKGKRTARYINKQLDTPTLSFIRNELKNIYGPIESGVADSLPIEMNNQVFIVDSGIEDSKIDFGVKSVKTISDNDLRKEYIRRKYDEAIRKGHISYELSSRFGDEYVDSWNGYRRLKFGKELSTNNGQSTNNERKFSKGNENDGRERLNFSHKDSQGRALNKAQQEFFKDSKVVDENGNLRAVYHGTVGEFYTFDKTYLGSATGVSDAKLGFFFTSDKNVALEYAINAHDTKFYNLAHKIADGDNDKFNKLLKVDGYKEFAMTEDVQELGVLKEKGENFEHDVYEVYLNIKNPLIDDWHGLTYRKAKMLKLVTRAIQENYDGVIIKNIDDSYDHDGQISDIYVIFEPNQVKFTSNKNPSTSNDMRFSRKANAYEFIENKSSNKITANMSEVERYEILKNKKIEDIPVAKELSKEQIDNIQSITSFEDLNKYFGAEKRSIIKKIASEFGVFKEYYNKDIELEFEFSKSNYNESYQKQKHNFVSYAKMFSVFDAVVEKAVGIEVHNRNIKNYKEDQTLKNVYVLASAFIDDQSIVPVKLEIKEFNDKNNKLYVAIALDKIKKTEVLEDRAFLDKEVTHSSLSVNISICDLLKNVNPNDKNFYKYIPKQFFDEDTETIKFSRKTNPTYTLSDGQVKKKVANFTKQKVYSKVEAERVINSILDSNLGFEDYDISISGKNKAEVIDVLWKTLNTADSGKRTGISLKIADYIIDNAVMENIYQEDENEIHLETIKYLKPYLHKVDLRGLKNEIKYRYDTDNSVYLLWGSRKGEVGQSADQIAMELAESGFFIDAENEADIFFEMDRAYRESVRALKKKSDKFLADTLGKEERNKLRQNIAKDILRAFDKKGSQTAFAKMIVESSKKAEFWKVLYYDEKNRNRAENDVVFAVERLDSIKKGESVAHTEFKDEIFNKTIGVLTKLKHKKSFNRSGTRNVIETLRKWATDEKNHLFKEDVIFQMEILPLMENIAENKTVGFDEIGYSIIEELQKKSGYSDINDIYEWYNKGNLKDDYNQLTKKFLSIYANEKKFTVQELKDIAKIVNYFRSFIEGYNKIHINNVRMDAFDMTKDFVKQINNNSSRKYSGAQRMYLASVFNQKTNYYRMFIDGKAIARVMDRYENGVCTFIMDLLEQGEVERALTTMNTLDKLDKFYEKHKKFQKKVEDKRIKYLDNEIPLGNAMLLYMELKSDDALRSLCASGFAYTNKDNKRVEIQGFKPDILDDADALKDEAKKLRDKLEKQFDEEDMQFIAICEDLFNNKLRKLKVATDENLLGFSNVIDGYYVPKHMADRSIKLEADKTYLDEVASVSNQSFNKSRIKGSYGRLSIESLPMVMKRHAEGIIKYHSFAQIERTINIVRNLDVGEDSNNVQTVNTEMKKVWKDFDAYFSTLYKDIRGVSKKDSFKLFSWLRGNYAKAVLGLNVKVLASQLSSYGAAGHILSIKALSKGVFVKSTTAEVYKYCPLAEYRRKENVSAQTQGVIDDVSSKFLEPIGFVDGFVINRLFGACQVQVEKDNNLTIGTEENKVKAGELLKKVILETQQNNFKASQVEGARNENELLKSFTMFKSDAIKNFGRWLDAYGELIFAKDKEAKKKAGKKLVKSSVVLISQASYLALLTSLFSHLFNTDDEDENDIWGFIKDAFGNLFGGIPIIGDFINSFTSGFDVEDMAFGTINDVIDSARNFTNMFDANTDSRERARTLRSLAYSITSLLGLPVKNAYKLIYGTINLASPETAYKMDDFFYKQSYSKDLTKAIQKGDEGMLTTITGLIMNENVGDFENGSTRSEVNRLLSAGFDVLPQSVPSSVTINEVQHSLTGPQQEKFRKAYSGAITAVDKLVSSNGYKIATDEAKAKAIKYVYRYYYYEAQHQALNVDLDSKLYLFGQIVPIEKMALALAEAPIIAEKSTNKKRSVQAYLQKSSLTAIQKYILMGYLGYKNTYGEAQVKALINKTNLSKKQREILLEKCGY